MIQQITLRNLKKPADKNPKRDIYWLCDSFGLATGRDTDSMSKRTFLSLLNRFRNEIGISAERIADDLGVSPARVNYHVRAFMDSGLVYRERRLIYLRSPSLKSAVEELRKDANRIFDELTEVAEEIDSALGFRYRS